MDYNRRHKSLAPADDPGWSIGEVEHIERAGNMRTCAAWAARWLEQSTARDKDDKALRTGDSG